MAPIQGSLQEPCWPTFKPRGLSDCSALLERNLRHMEIYPFLHCPESSHQSDQSENVGVKIQAPMEAGGREPWATRVAAQKGRE